MSLSPQDRVRKSKVVANDPNLYLPKLGYLIEDEVILEDCVIYIAMCPLGRLCCVVYPCDNKEGNPRVDDFEGSERSNSILVTDNALEVCLDNDCRAYKVHGLEPKLYPAILYKNFIDSPEDFLRSVDKHYIKLDNILHTQCVSGTKRIDKLLEYIEQNDITLRSGHAKILECASKISSLKEDTLINSTNNTQPYTLNVSALIHAHAELDELLSNYNKQCDRILLRITHILQDPIPSSYSIEPIKDAKPPKDAKPLKSRVQAPPNTDELDDELPDELPKKVEHTEISVKNLSSESTEHIEPPAKTPIPTPAKISTVKKPTPASKPTPGKSAKKPVANK